MCPNLKLIIEVDGITHDDEQVRLNDHRRQSDLQAAGFTVIRFADEEVLTDINGVIMRITDAISAIESPGPPPTPSGGGQNTAPGNG
jgi:very-short-patch-repair endonuclease